MSPGASAGFAPCWMSLLQPSEVGLVIGPGTARTARPWSSAQSAVIRAPDPGAASITTVTPASPEIRRLRLGNEIGRAPRLNSSHTVISYAVFCLKKKIRYNDKGLLNNQK